MRLEHLAVGQILSGLGAEHEVTVVDIQWHGAHCVELTYLTPDAAHHTVGLFRRDEQRLSLARRMSPSPATPPPGATLHVEQKWGFGMAPVKPATQTRRIQSAIRAEKFLLDPKLQTAGLRDQLLEDLPEVKGLFGRSCKQDQWDWFTVWEQLGRPSTPRARDIGLAIGDVRRALLHWDDTQMLLAREKFIQRGGPHFLSEYIRPRRFQEDPRTGYIYILSTRESPQLLKIGYTTRNVRDRVDEINRATGVAIPYGARAVWVVRDAPRVEKLVHQELHEHRVRSDREFFNMHFNEAKRTINALVRQLRLEETPPT